VEHTRAVRKLDGGLSTALEQRGEKLTGSLWTGELLRTNPQRILQAHKDFVSAGAEIIITSAYQISFSGCAERGWSKSEVKDALRLSTELAREAMDGRNVQVAASIGPYGASLGDGSEYRGRYGVSKKIIRDFHQQRLELLLESGPDLLALETMPDIDEVEIILELIEETGSTIPFWVAYSCKEGGRTNAGQSFGEAVDLVNEANNAMAVGINCTAPNLVAELLKSANSSHPFIVYPNSGREWDATKKVWVGPSTGAFHAGMLAEWTELGTNIIGGCCGVSPADIEKMELP
jgi:homocysteine S-methyltransferase